MFHWLLDTCCLTYFAIIPTLSFKTLFCSHDILSEQSHFLLNYHFFHSLNGLELSKTQGSIKRTSNVLEVLFSPKKFIVSNAIAWHFWMEEVQSHLVLVIVTFTQCGKFEPFSVTHILREINFWDLRSSKNAIICHFEDYEFRFFGHFLPLQSAKTHKNQHSEPQMC